MNRIDYCAGLIDGEGSIFILRRKTKSGGTYFVPLLAVGMTNKSPLDVLDNTLIGKIETYAPRKTTKGTTRKQVWKFICRGEALVNTLKLLSPYLILKRPQAEVVLEFYNLPRWSRDTAIKKAKEELYNKMVELNK